MQHLQRHSWIIEKPVLCLLRSGCSNTFWSPPPLKLGSETLSAPPRLLQLGAHGRDQKVSAANSRILYIFIIPFEFFTLLVWIQIYILCVQSYWHALFIKKRTVLSCKGWSFGDEFIRCSVTLWLWKIGFVVHEISIKCCTIYQEISLINLTIMMEFAEQLPSVPLCSRILFTARKLISRSHCGCLIILH